MSQPPPRVVLDTVVFVQALISGRGPSAACIERLKFAEFVLFISDPLLGELSDVPLRPELTARYPYLTLARVEAFLRDLQTLAVTINHPPHVFTLPRDPRDEPLIDLAVAAEADFLVTWNHRHLTRSEEHRSELQPHSLISTA